MHICVVVKLQFKILQLASLWGCPQKGR